MANRGAEACPEPAEGRRTTRILLFLELANQLLESLMHKR
jgi:hypothetical protein